MTHREQKETIAEFAGWKTRWIDNRSDRKPGALEGWWTEMPDYPNDFNELVSVLKLLDYQQTAAFITELVKLTELKTWPSSRQVTEALIRAIGKWKE